MEGGDLRWRGRGVIAGGEERSLVKGSDRFWRGDGGERSQVEGSGLRWREAFACGGKRSQMTGSNRWWRERLQVEGSGLVWRVKESDRW